MDLGLVPSQVPGGYPVLLASSPRRPFRRSPSYSWDAADSQTFEAGFGACFCLGSWRSINDPGVGYSQR